MPYLSDLLVNTPRQNHNGSRTKQPRLQECVKVPSKNDKKRPMVDDYRYLNVGLGQQQPTPDEVQMMAASLLSEKHRIERRANRVKTKMDESDATYLANEMDRMLGVANPVSQGKLFKIIKKSITSLVDKTPAVSGSVEATDNKLLSIQSKPTKKYRAVDEKATKKSATSVQRSSMTTNIGNNVPIATIMSSIKQKQKMRKLSTAGPVARLARETSVITTTTTTTTRCKLKDPAINLIETSKTNMLHRCYGKQNVKALTQVQKINRKSNNVYQRPNTTKASQNIIYSKPLKQKQFPTNQQMKTIYENEQFVKPKNTITTLVESGSTSSSSLEQKPSLHGILKKNNNWPKTKTEPLEVTKEQDEPQLKPVIENLETREKVKAHDNDKDNSLVQRLTCFWNQKLNTDSNLGNVTNQGEGVLIEEIDLFPSLTPITDKKSEYKMGNDSLVKSANKDSTHSIHTNNVQEKGGGNGKSEKLDEEDQLPDLKLGLVDELIRVLERKSTQTLVNDNERSSDCSEINYDIDEDNCKKQNEKSMVPKYSNNNDDIDSNSSSDEYDNCEDVDEECQDESMEDYDEESRYSSNNMTYNQDNSVIQAISTCMVRKITVCKHVKDNEYVDDFYSEDTDGYESDNKTTTTTEDSSIMSGPESHDTLKTFTVSDQIKNSDILQNEQGIQEKYINLNQGENTDTVTDKNQLVVVNNNGPLNNNRSDKIITTITNVNDIIINLRRMIEEIESIPDEPKTRTKSLNNLSLSDTFSQALSILVDNEPKKSEIILLDTNSSNGLSHTPYLTEIVSTPCNESPLNKCDVISKMAVGGFKIQGRSLIYNLPSTFTLPIWQNVMNPIELILFPKRHEYLKSRSNSYIVEYNELDKIENKCSSLNIVEESIKNQDGDYNNHNEGVNEELMTCVTRFKKRTPYHSTVFYMTSKSKDMMSVPSMMFHPLQKKETTVVLANRSNISSEEEVVTANETNCDANIGGLDNNDPNVTMEEHNKENTNLQKNCIINVDVGTEGNASVSNQVTSNNNRRRRCLFQTVNADEDNILTGGSGDYGSVATPFNRTSSMSVMAPTSVNDSNSQPDINMNDSEHRSGIVISQSDVTSVSRDVIYETDEHLSDIDDYIPNQMPETDMSNTNTQIDSCSSQVDGLTVTITDNDDNLSVTRQKATSTTELEMCVTKIPTRDIGIMTTSSLTSKDRSPNYPEVDTNTDDKDVDKDIKLTKDYVVFCCNTETPQRVFRHKAKTSTNVYNLDTLFKTDPKLQHELGDLIDIDNLCEKERKLITVCLVLVKRNNNVENTLTTILLRRINETLTFLWKKTKCKVIDKIYQLAKNKRLIKEQSENGDYILCFKFKQLIKIIYTVFVSLTLCFIIQKNFLGFELPIRFPW